MRYRSTLASAAAWRRGLLLLLVSGLVPVAGAAWASPSFQGVGFDVGLEVDATAVRVGGVSADGRVVVGEAEVSLGRSNITRWTMEDGLELLPRYIPAPPLFDPLRGNAASGDGSVIVGTRRFGPRVWTEATGMINTAPNGESFNAPAGSVWAVSDDGLSFGGRWDPGTRTAPWYYSSSTGRSEILLPGSQQVQRGGVNGLSGDGRYAVGRMFPFIFGGGPAVPPEFVDEFPPGLSGRAFRWSLDGGTELLSLGAPGEEIMGASASAASFDGSIVVGSREMATGGSRAFVWDAATASAVLLDALDASVGTTSGASDVTADGLVVVGGSAGQAFIWDAATGTRSLEQVLSDVYGIDLEGWSLTSASGISGDGRVIVGNGINPDGVAEGWVAVIPEPGTALLLGAGLLGLGLGGRRAGV